MEEIKNYKVHIIVGVIILAIVGYFLYKNKKAADEKKKNVGGNPNTTTLQIPTGQTTPQIGTKTQTASKFPLQKGIKYPEVVELQKALKLGADGVIGSQTEAAIQKYGFTVPLSQSDYALLMAKLKYDSMSKTDVAKSATLTVLDAGSFGMASALYRLFS